MTKPPETRIGASAAVLHGGRLLSPARYHEAALIAGLTGVGMAAGRAFSAVPLYRLATCWLPIAPGWLAWRALLRREYV
jgi:hypothetical protein